MGKSKTKFHHFHFVFAHRGQNDVSQRTGLVDLPMPCQLEIISRTNKSCSQLFNFDRVLTCIWICFIPFPPLNVHSGSKCQTSTKLYYTSWLLCYFKVYDVSIHILKCQFWSSVYSLVINSCLVTKVTPYIVYLLNGFYTYICHLSSLLVAENFLGAGTIDVGHLYILYGLVVDIYFCSGLGWCYASGTRKGDRWCGCTNREPLATAW
jgi:hypothetical protein